MIGEIMKDPKCGDVVRLFGGLVVLTVTRVERDEWQQPDVVHYWREETPPSGSSDVATTCHAYARGATWRDLCRAACSWSRA